MTKSEWPTSHDTGETGRRTRGRLDRAPGDRYFGPSRAAGTSAGDDGPTPVVASETRIWLAAVYGSVAALAVAAAWALAVGLLDITWGLVFVAALGGWVIGAAAAFGAWHGKDHRAEPRVRTIAAVVGALAWLVGSLGAYLIALIVLPASDLSLGERIAGLPFSDALVTQFSLVDVASIALLVVLAWRSAR